MCRSNEAVSKQELHLVEAPDTASSLGSQCRVVVVIQTLLVALFLRSHILTVNEQRISRPRRLFGLQRCIPLSLSPPTFNFGC